MFLKSFALVVSLLFLFLGCSQQISQMRFTKPSDKIMGGSQVPPQDFTAQSTVGIYDHLEQGICTGTLIAPNIVLTAAHCLSSRPKNMRIIFHENIDDTLNAREPDIKEAFVRKVSEYRIHPNYAPQQDQEKYDLNDIGLIRFQGSIPEGFKPVEFLKNTNVLQKGMWVTVAGYGVTKVEAREIDPKNYPDFEESLKYGLVICFDTRNTDCIELHMEGDGTLLKAQAQISKIHHSEFSLDETKGQGTCSGDSGGPAYIKIGDKILVAGVTSRGSMLCNDEGVYSSTAAHGDWLSQTVNELMAKVVAK
ncbi:MAG: S1 family peptidase [Bdellovibrionia bacterium]